ncbi:sensor histidine kinase/response regulator [Parvularcula bermudensis HTCC2503]|uniref:histidine kinase n=2 Tax=Parvularcula TaxID=208215 RepID=E0TE33_PARBH|nr:sensor histidine kinase/response regulator [Parvularcula bermudensis HTCC2503]
MRELPTRLFVITVGVSAVSATGRLDHLLCVAIYLLILGSQLTDAIVWYRLSRCTESALPWHCRFGVLSAFQASMCYGLFPVYVWISDIPAGQAIAYTMLSGNLLHTALHQNTRILVMISAAIPPLVYMAGLPIYQMAVDPSFYLRDCAALLTIEMLVILALLSGAKAIRTVTQQREEERAAAEQASRAKSVFLATMSHEIRTPLNGILGMAEALAASALPEDSRSKAETIRDSGALLLQMLNNSLDLSKIEAGKLEIDKAPFRLDRAIERVHALFAQQARNAGLTFTTDIDRSLPMLREGDEQRLTQILTNLIGNALKFTQSGGVTIGLHRGKGATDIVLSVKDTGIGMSDEQQAKIFMPFTQAEGATTTRRFGGTGLGLSIVKALTAQMGGEVILKSVAGVGSEFSVCLPLPEAATKSLPERHMNGRRDLETISGLRLLVIDDNRVNLTVIDALLRPLGAQLTTCLSGEEGVALATSADVFDVILVDISMEGMDGPETLRVLRERLGGACPPVLAVSAHAFSDDITRFIALGFEGYVTKPVNRERLVKAIADARLSHAATSAMETHYLTPSHAI